MPDITDKLERLAGLLEKELLTREEFDQQKAALLAEATTPSGTDLRQVGAYRMIERIGDGARRCAP